VVEEAACIASRTASLPRNEKEMLLTPPDTFTSGICLLDLPGGLDEVQGVAVVLLDASGDREDVGIEDDVFGREAGLLGEQPVGPWQIATFRSTSVACPSSSNAITTTAAP
jgi:hypothetical protein